MGCIFIGVAAGESEGVDTGSCHSLPTSGGENSAKGDTISPLHIPWFVTGWTHRRRWLGTPIAWPAHNCYVVYFEEYLHKDDMTRSVSHDRSCAVSTTLVSRLVGRGRAWPCVPVLQSRNSGSRQSSLPGGGFGKAAPLLDSLKSFMDAGERKEAFV